MSDFLLKFTEDWALLEQDKATLVSIVRQLQNEVKILWEEKTKYQSEGQKRDREQRLTLEELKNLYVDASLRAENYKKIVDLRLGAAYSVDAPWIDRIVFILRDAERPLKSSEINQLLVQNDIVFRETVNEKRKMLSRYLSLALKYGRIRGQKLPGINGYLYSIPNTESLQSSETCARDQQ